jgi:peptide/nickel transport system substrate-binding protein
VEERERLTRRRFLHLSAVAAGGTMLAACGAAPQATQTPATTGNSTALAPVGEPTLAAETPGITGAATTAPAPAAFKESPALAALVKAGKLPPIGERLPKEPYIVRPGLLISDEYVKMQPGKYGGTMQLAQEAPSGDPVIFLGNIEPLLAGAGGLVPEGFAAEDIEGNVVEGYEVNKDDTEFTFYMREGLKWSDGEPVTMEDVTFAFEDVLYNKEITPLFPLYLRAGLRADAAPAKLKVVDDRTFSLKFDAPYGSFPTQIAVAGWRSYTGVIKPRHYLEQFHVKYADPKQLREELKEESIPEDQWFNLFNAKQLTEWMWNVTNEQGIGHPTLTAWVIKSVKSSVFTFERNPYYFKVDSAGNQLPYIDGIRSQVVQSKETLSARALMGEFDYMGERASLKQLPLIAERAERRQVKMSVARMHRQPVSFGLNLTYDDKNWRKIVRDIRFRRALSLAMNRKEIIETFYLGEFASLPEETNPSEHNVDEANRLLDEMGLDRKDARGFRLGPDGKRFSIHFEVPDLSEDHIPMSELIAEYWRNVGVFTTVRLIDGTLLGERMGANRLLGTAIWLVNDMWRSATWLDYTPQAWWAPLWEQWYNTQGEGGEEPPEEIRQLYELHGKYLAARTGSEESKAAIEAIFKNHRDNIWTFNPVENFYYPTFWTTRIKNVPEGVKQDVFGVVANLAMEQWFIDE